MTDSIAILEESPLNQKINIRPYDIEINVYTNAITSGGFGKYEVDLSAGKLVLFFQSRGYWSSFYLSEVMAFYKMKGWSIGGIFFGLMGLWYDDAPLIGGLRQSHPVIVIYPDGTMGVTREFIQRCAGKYITE